MAKLTELSIANTQQFLAEEPFPRLLPTPRRLELDWRAAHLVAAHSFEIREEELRRVTDTRSLATRRLLALNDARANEELEAGLDELWDYLQREIQRFGQLAEEDPEADGYLDLLDGLEGLAAIVAGFDELSAADCALQALTAESALTRGRAWFQSAAA